ncbi:GNAT family N-acetyltransferase [Asanoa ishikariensis]|uniref:Aminoglycoside 6'-N-acetyltransferase n=1 Tax=Asanoa ishikariensis TaxID=137265 RepID=A0A1H3RTW8_9ACTN|nr:GNAT family protein [Asanoa ishikariensis]GIF66826.1 GNAT family N-acetyltransferase [Asanoa ishikariensis]SDZ29154.1 aminoglycoside 6'-N-acetyltransferase [Asanoa ishikariensis]
MTTLTGALVLLRPATDADIAPLAVIRSAPEVTRWWGDEEDYPAAVAEDLERTFVIEVGGRMVGAVQTYEEDDPMYRHAGMDIYLEPSSYGRGIGTDAVRTMARHLINTVGHHRLVIDPAANNAAAIRAYEKVGFQRVGVLRRYERGPDGTFHDGLLLDLLHDDLID